MFVYDITPIDFRWEFLHSVEDVAAALAKVDAGRLSKRGDSGEPTCAEFLEAFKDAKDKAGSAGWDGDFRDGPVVFWVPGDGRFEYGFVFKQDSNGTTYVVSPHKLPHLEELV